VLNPARQEEGTYTLDEFLAYVENEKKRYELVAGYIYMMASPTTEHQQIVLSLGNTFSAYFKGKECTPFVAPLDVRLLEEDGSCNNVYQPDVLIVCDKDKIKTQGIEGAPDLVVEVTSKSTSNMDYIMKLHNYMRLGVKECWLINPMTRQTLVYQRLEGETAVCAYPFDETLKAGLFEGLQVGLQSY
jgi:Uma2 family endonuclease